MFQRFEPEPTEGDVARELTALRARAQGLADEQLRARIKRYLGQEGITPRRGSLPRGKVCGHCRDAPRYPDYHCAEHTAFLPEGGVVARLRDNDAAQWLTLWRVFFERVDSRI
jgi:hypothetical protein